MAMSWLTELPAIEQVIGPVIATLITVELSLRVRGSTLVCSLLQGIKRTIISLFDDQLNDAEREVALRRAALSMLSVSFKTLLIFLLIGLFFWSDELLFTALNLESLPSPWLLIGKSLLSVLYWFSRRRFSSELNTGDDGLQDDSTIAQDPAANKLLYSEISKGLHAFALEGELISRLSFEYERRRYLKKETLSTPEIHQPVWVCGLARAGTTILTDLLYETERFTSLTYRHMPFPLAPNLWRRFSRWGISGEQTKVERAHGDGLMVSIDSPEALEEVFWRTYEPHIYIDHAQLSSHQPCPKTFKAFREYIQLLLIEARANGQHHTRYLSKNNNHLMRLPSLLKEIPQGQVIIPLRHPFEHAESLRRQHIRWVERHADDPFSRSYMDWLAHHEFGSGHIPFSLCAEKSSSLFKPNPDQMMNIEYWAERWLDAYQRVDQISSAQTRPQQITLIDYDDLSAHPISTLTALSAWLDLDLSSAQIAELSHRLKPAPKRVRPEDISFELRDRLLSQYRSLYSRCIRA